MSKPKPNHAQQQIKKLAIELYEQALAAGHRIDLADLIAKLVEDLEKRFTAEDHSIVRELIEISAREAVKDVDAERTKSAEQPTLLDDLDRAVAIGDSVRRVRRHMTAQDWAVHITYVNANRNRVNAAADKEDRRYKALLPYLNKGMDTEKALAAWQSDHEGEVLP